MQGSPGKITAARNPRVPVRFMCRRLATRRRIRRAAQAVPDQAMSNKQQAVPVVLAGSATRSQA